MILTRFLRDPNSHTRNPEASSEWTIIGGVIGIALMLGAGLLGLKSLPEWAEIPAVVVAFQAGFSRLLGHVLTQRHGPIGGDPGDLTYEEITFALFGVITLPGTTLFIATMAVITAL